MKNTVTVVGAGVIGATTALAFAESGFMVNIVESADHLSAGASGDNGAQLSYSNTDSLASPATLRSLPKFLLGLDSSFRVNPKFNRRLISWGIDFLRNCSDAKSNENTLAVLQLALQSQSVLHSWNEKYSFSYKQQKNAKLHLYEDAVALESMQRRIALKNQFGASQSIITPQEVYELEPTLSKARLELAGAIYSPEEEVGDVTEFVPACIDKALEIGGGRLFLGTEVVGVNKTANQVKSLITKQMDIEGDIIVVCSGHQSNDVLRCLGVQCSPIIPVAGYSLTYGESDYTPQISVTDVAKKTVLCNLGDKLRVAGMADVGYTPRFPTANRIRTLEASLKERFPLAGNYEIEPSVWVGMRPMTASGQPIINQTGIDNLFINSGHGMLGWTLAAGSANRVRDLVLDRC